MRRPPLVTAVLVAGVLVVASACSTPATGVGTESTGRARVTALLDDAATALPASVRPEPATATGTATCRKKVLGYAVGTTGKHRIEAPLLVMAGEADPVAWLDPIAARWREHGFTVDTSGQSDQRYPKVRATTPDGYTIVATAITDSPQRLDLYVTSQCLASD